jgi:hypothetical protein
LCHGTKSFQEIRITSRATTPLWVFEHNGSGKVRAVKTHMTQSSEETVAEIEELTRALDGDSGTPSGLMREHLEAARFYLLGSMPSEYEFSLKLASDMLSDIQDSELQARVGAFLQSQKL